MRNLAVEIEGQLADATVLGSPIHPVSRLRAVRAIVDRATDQSAGAYVCLNNAHTTVEAHHSRDLRTAIEGAFLSVADGMPIVWLLRGRGYRYTEKVTGAELMPMVAAGGRNLGLRHLLYGGATGIAEKAAAALVERVPGTEVVGALSPPFAALDGLVTRELEEAVRTRRPHILWVGLGAPKQELWMAKMAGKLDVPVMVGVGAAFDFLSGNKPDAPAFIRHGGLEWLFRLLSEPRRLWRRYLVGNSEFVYLLIRHALASGLRKNLNMRSKTRSGRSR